MTSLQIILTLLFVIAGLLLTLGSNKLIKLSHSLYPDDSFSGFRPPRRILRKIKEEDITGLKPFYIGLIVSSFFLVLKWTTNLIESYNLWNYAITFGAVVITYFIISRIRFNQL